MNRDTITLVMKGDVSLEAFSTVIGTFSALIHQLSDELVGADKIEWEISQLEVASATATVRGMSDDEADVAAVVLGWDDLGEALEQQRPIPFSEVVAEHAIYMTSVLDGKITSLEFVTEGKTSSVTEPFVEEEEEVGIGYSLGVISGIVETISLRGRTKFVLYDDLFDRAVYCYLAQDKRERLREIWGKRVSVSGWIARDPNTGRPFKIRDVISIEIRDEPPPDSYKRARGSLLWEVGDPLPEDAIRRVRDAL